MSNVITTTIALGELWTGREAVEIPNLGSGVALIGYDRVAKLGGIAHIALPESSIGQKTTEKNSDAKYANEAVPLLVERMMAEGAQKAVLGFRMAGGAQLFNFGGGGNPLNVGSRTAIAVRAALSKLGFAIEKADIGGNKGRKIEFTPATGQVIVTQIGSQHYFL